MPGRVALVFAIIAVVLAIAHQMLTVWVVHPSQVCDAVMYPSVEAEHAAHRVRIVSLLQAFGVIHLVPSIVAVVLGVIGVRRPRPVAAAVALGAGALSTITAVLDFVLLPLIADAGAIAASC